MSIRKIIIIAAVCALCLIIEALLATLLGRWFKPNLVLIAVVFFNLSWGTRYSLAAAIIGGLLKDSFSANFFGLNIFSFISSAYLTTLIKLYVYHVGSKAGRIMMVVLIVILNSLIQGLLKIALSSVNVFQVFNYVFMPEVLTTSVIAGYALDKLKRCVSNLSV